MIFLHGMSVGIILNHYISNDIPFNPKKSYGPMVPLGFSPKICSCCHAFQASDSERNCTLTASQVRPEMTSGTDIKPDPHLTSGKKRCVSWRTGSMNYQKMHVMDLRRPLFCFLGDNRVLHFSLSSCIPHFWGWQCLRWIAGEARPSRAVPWYAAGWLWTECFTEFLMGLATQKTVPSGYLTRF